MRRFDLFLLFILIPMHLAQAQCEPSLLSGGQIMGINGPVLANTVWDPDGFGPMAPVFVVGGTFTIAGDVEARNLAYWDGYRWHPLGGGVDGGFIDTEVKALIVLDGDLVVGGDFSTAGGIIVHGLARWDGDAWHPFGGGLDDNDAFITDFAIFNDELVAAGLFDSISGVESRSLARWDGIKWHTFPPGPNHAGTLPLINDIIIQGDQLIVGGNITAINGVASNPVAALNGNSWTGLGTPVLNQFAIVNALREYDGALIAGGDFSASTGLIGKNIAKWDGISWSSLGGGTDNKVSSLFEFEGRLIVGGEFLHVNLMPIRSVASWNGFIWQALGVGPSDFTRGVTNMELFGGELIIGGDFKRIGGFGSQSVGRWDGTAWHGFGLGFGEPNSTGAYLNSNTVYNGQLIVAGDMEMIGGVSANDIAAWNGASWSSLSSGTSTGSYVSALAVHEGELIMGGLFWFAGDVLAPNIASWNGLQWARLGGGLSDSVQALTVYDSQLIAAGWFASTPGLELRRIARWDGTAWHPLGNGLNNVVSALATYGPDLIAAGRFTTAGVGPAYHIARWDGQNWYPIGSGIGGNDADVISMVEYDNHLFVGGFFQTAGGIATSGFAKWDGLEWSAVDVTITEATVWAMLIHEGKLLIAGRFSIDGIIFDYGVAEWNGSELRLPSSTDHPVVNGILGLAAYSDGSGERLWAVGSFTATTQEHIWKYLIEWGCSCPHCDSDADGDVDLLDFAAWVMCLDGPDIPYPFRCDGARLDAGISVDLRDYSILMNNYQP